MKDSLYHMDPIPHEKKGEPVKRKALIVDDESDICYLLSSILRQADIQSVFANSITEAEKKLQSPDSFYYLFLDNYLPDGLGIDQVKKWKDRFPFIHLIMITAHDSYEEKNRAKNDGADHFISKPFSKDLILKAIVQTSD